MGSLHGRLTTHITSRQYFVLHLDLTELSFSGAGVKAAGRA